MADYGKKKNDELMTLCKERSLPHTGKKADLVKRLEDHDANGTSKPAAAAEDEIDWDDEPAKEATTEQAANAVAAGGVGEVPNPAAVPNQHIAEDPAKTDDLTVAAAPATDAAAPEEVKEKDFSSGMMERTIDDEIEKRKARARKFGMPEDSDEIRQLERSKRFGTTDISAVPGLLNKALSERQDRKRGREGGENDGGIRKQSRGRGKPKPGMGRRQESDRPKENGSGGSGSWMTDQDREKAERRKERFAGTA